MTADGLWHRTRGAAAKEQRAHNCNSVMGAFNEMRQALAHIASKSDPTKRESHLSPPWTASEERAYEQA